jgi:hypothetical protein
MLKKIIIFLLFLTIFINLASAQIIVVNETTIPTFIPTAMPTPKIIATPTDIPLIMEKLSQTFYGEARYIDGNPIARGSIITAKDQYGVIIGNYTIREVGEYGSSKPYGEKMVVSVLRNQSDRSSRSTVTFVNFFVDGVRARDSATFRVGEDTNFNILLTIVKPTPIPTTIATPIPTETPVPTIARPINTSTITPIQVTALPSPAQSTTSTIIPGIEDMQLVIYGFIGMVIVIVGIIIIVIIQTYLMNRSSRDESLGPDGKWDRK